MYCRKCHYDLRGQTSPPRCPECGRGFIPGDVTTYYVRIPTLLTVAHTRWRTIAQIATTLLLALYYVPWPTLIGCGGYSFHSLTARNLCDVAEVWRAREYRSQFTLVTSPLAYLPDLPRRLSPKTQWSLLLARAELRAYLREDIAANAKIVIVYCGLMAVLSVRWLRKWMIRALVAAVLAVVICAFDQQLSEAWIPGDYRYLDDYTFVTPTDWNVARGNPRVIGFVTNPNWAEQRVVGFSDGSAYMVREEEFRRMAIEQGIVFEP